MRERAFRVLLCAAASITPSFAHAQEPAQDEPEVSEPETDEVETSEGETADTEPSAEEPISTEVVLDAEEEETTAHAEPEPRRSRPRWVDGSVTATHFEATLISGLNAGFL